MVIKPTRVIRPMVSALIWPRPRPSVPRIVTVYPPLVPSMENQLTRFRISDCGLRQNRSALVFAPPPDRLGEIRPG